MQVYNTSRGKTEKLTVYVNWSRELTFSPRQINFIKNTIPHARGVYCVYAKDYRWQYRPYYLSGLVYIGSGWLDERLCHHLKYQKNDILYEYLSKYDLAYRYDRIQDDEEDWPRNVEAALLYFFKERFGDLPPANRREESLADLGVIVEIKESWNFSFLRDA